MEETNEAGAEATESFIPSPEPWHLIFEEERKEIIMLWHLCHVSIIHRTQFYFLFKGDPADQMYLEVELRRLTWLERHLSDLGNASPALLGDEPAGSVSARYVHSRISTIESDLKNVRFFIRVSVRFLAAVSRPLSRKESTWRKG